MNNLPVPKGPLEEYYSGYIRVDRRGTVLYNCMENTGIFGAFLRRHGIIGADREWHKDLGEFKYSSAFRVKGGELKHVDGNLFSFALVYKENILYDLDGREITEFLKIGDYSPSGIIRLA